MRVLKIIGIYLGALALAYVCAPIGEWSHRLIWEPSCMTPPCNDPALLEGFVYFFVFWFAVYLFYHFPDLTGFCAFLWTTSLVWIIYFYLVLTTPASLRLERVGGFFVALVFTVLGFAAAKVVRGIRHKE